MLNVKKVTLPNRLRVVVTPMKTTEAVTVMILVRAGSRYETKDINGIAHFLEHMFFKGGKRYADSHAVSEAVDAIGGEFNAFTSNEDVGYYIKVAKEHIETAFDVLSDMMMNAKFEEDGLERERGVILEEYKMVQDEPKYQIEDDFEQLMFGDHPLGRTTIGLPQVIRKVKRADFVKYKNRLYTAPNVVISVAGNTDVAQVKKLVCKYLPYPKTTKKNMPVIFKGKRPADRVWINNKPTEQAHLLLGVPLFGAQHPDKYVVKVLRAILGGGMSSRLFTSIRERHGLAYYVFATSSQYCETGYFAAKAGVDKDRIELAIKTILAEFETMTREKVSEKELNKAKEFIIGHLVLGIEDSEAVAASLGLQELLYGQTESIPEIKKQIRAVTADRVMALAKKIFRKKDYRLAVIGPFKDKKLFSSLLN